MRRPLVLILLVMPMALVAWTGPAPAGLGSAAAARQLSPADRRVLREARTALAQSAHKMGWSAIDDEQRYLRQRERELRVEHEDASGRVRPDLWVKGVHEWSRMPISATWRAVPHLQAGTLNTPAVAGASATSAAPITGVQWSQIGPQPLRIDNEANFQGAGPASGEIVDIAVDTRNSTDRTMYIATNGGVWKTTDGGTTWLPKTDNLPSSSVGSVALDPTNQNIVYAGSGNVAAGSCIFFRGVGLYKSFDGGDTWSVLGGSLFNNVAIYGIKVLPGNVVLLGTSQGLYRSIDGGQTFGSNSPNFDNNQPVLPGFITDLDLDTTAANTVYASVGTYTRCGITTASPTGVFRSTDGGQTFTNLFTATNGAPTATSVYVAFAQSTAPNNQTMYASTATGSATYGGLYQSTDGGANWTNKPAANAQATNCQCRYDHIVGVDPRDANRVYIGFQELHRSDDGGNTFTTVGANAIHDDLHSIVFSPHDTSDPTTFYLGSDAGIHVSTDTGGTFINTLNETISTNLFVQIDIGRGSPANNQYSYGGTQDTGTIDRRPGDAALDWHLTEDGDGGAVAVDPTNGARAYIGGNRCYKRTTDGGNTWSVPTPGLPAGECLNQAAVDPVTPTTVYVASGAKLFRSLNGGDAFTQIATAPAGISDIDMTALDQNVLWLGLADGRVSQVTGASGLSPALTTFTVTGAPAGQGVNGVAVDPTDTNTVVAVYPGFSGVVSNRSSHVFRTTDGGTTWTNISGTAGGNPSQNLPDLPLHSVVIDPGTSPHTIIVSSDTGVARSIDTGASWQRLGVGLPTVDSKSLQLDSLATPPVLRLGTFGRSVFELTSASGPAIAVNADLSFDRVPVGRRATRVVQVFNVGSSDLHILSFTRSAGSTEFSVIGGPTTPVTIRPGEELDWTVQYAPTNTGDDTATFSVASDDPNTPRYDIPASGTGVSGNIRLSGDLAFGTVARGTSQARAVSIENTGEGFLTVTDWHMDASGDPSFTIDEPSPTASSPLQINPGESATIHVRFSPPANSNDQQRTSVLHVLSDDPDTPDATLNASGRAGVPATSVSTGSLDFHRVPVDNRTQPHTANQVVTIYNQSSCDGCDAHVSAEITPAGSDFTLVNPPTFPYKLGAGNHLDLTVRFNPSAVGTRGATLTITSDDPDSADQSVPVTLAGEGTLAGISTPHNDLLPPDAGADPVIFPPTVYDPVCAGVCGTTLNEPYTNNGIAELIVDRITFAGSTAFSGLAATSPPSRFAANDGSVESVTFHPTGGAARRLTGTMTITDNVDGEGQVQRTVAFCGESVGRGFRVKAVDANGTPFTQLKSLKLQSHGFRSNISENLKNLTLTTIDPPTTCRRVQYQYENQNLPDTTRAGNQGAYYDLTITVGNQSKTMSFTLGINEFKTIVMTIP